MQVTKYTVREVLNHKRLVHPHIVEMKEVSTWDPYRLIGSKTSLLYSCSTPLTCEAALE